jgi:hypothetical protein
VVSSCVSCDGYAVIILDQYERAREAIRLTDDQLDSITTGGDFNQLPSITPFLVNGSNGLGGVNRFSLSIATLVPAVT